MVEVSLVLRSLDSVATIDDLVELANKLQEDLASVLDDGYYRTYSGKYIKISDSVE